MKKLFDQHFLSHLLSLLALALLMPMGAWGQTAIAFGEVSQDQTTLDVKESANVNWRERTAFSLPSVWFLYEGGGYESASESGLTYSSSDETVATVNSGGNVTFIAYELQGTCTVTCR